VPEDCIIQNSLHRVRAQNLFDLVFLLYILSAASKCGYLDSECNKATIVHFTGEKFGNLRIPWPPKDQRAYIASFLDEETTRIDALISKKHCQLELLEEKRTALITQAVTKGLNPCVKMKDSGVEWLGEVPAQWEVASVKRLAGISYGLGQPPKEIQNGIALIRATDISRGAIDLSKCLRVDPNDVPAGRNAFLKPGDIIVVRSGAYTGDSALVPNELAGAVAGYDMIVRCSNCTSQFMAYVLLSSLMAYQMTMAASRAAQDHLNAEQLGNCTLALPPVEEQFSIVRYLDGATTRIDALKKRIQHSIELLQEYRSALISAAVTGQIDVREEVM